MMGQTIGVDFGHTCSSVVAVRENESLPRTVMFTDSLGRATDTLPTVVAYFQLGYPHVGGQPLAWSATDPTRTVYGFKRLLGCTYTDPQVQSVLSGLGWRAVPDPDGGIAAQLDSHTPLLPLDDVAVEVFRDLHDATVATVGRKADGVAISVPACFAPSQVEAILAAARTAGWPESHACSEPAALAAALASLGIFADQFVAMCDLGGGKFEASVVEFGAPGTFRLLSTCGEPLLGGDDLDGCVMEDVLAGLSQQVGVDLRNDALARLRVLAELRATRPMLDRQGQVKLQLPFLALKADGAPLHAQVTLTRERHDDLMTNLLARIEEVCRRALEQAGIDRYDTRGNVVATEGYAALCAYGRAIERGFGAPRFVLKKHLIAYGAALLAGHTDRTAAAEG